MLGFLNDNLKKKKKKLNNWLFFLSVEICFFSLNYFKCIKFECFQNLFSLNEPYCQISKGWTFIYSGPNFHCMAFDIKKILTSETLKFFKHFIVLPIHSTHH